MHGKHPGGVPTSILAVFKLVKTLISEKIYGLCSTCAVHRFLKRKMVVGTQEQTFGMKSVH